MCELGLNTSLGLMNVWFFNVTAFLSGENCEIISVAVLSTVPSSYAIERGVAENNCDSECVVR